MVEQVASGLKLEVLFIVDITIFFLVVKVYDIEKNTKRRVVVKGSRHEGFVLPILRGTFLLGTQ